jgi:membrane fusion protein, multidrug efflux system
MLAPSPAATVRPARRRWLAWTVALTGMTAIVVGLGGYKFLSIKAAIAAAAAYPEPTEAVEAVQPVRRAWAPTVRAVGTTVAIRRVELRNELPGRVAEVGFKSGETVKAGAVLVRLDASLEQADLAALKADSELARLTLERQQILARTQAVSQAALDQAKAQMNAAAAKVAALEVAIAKKTLKAPFDARVGLSNLQPGSYLPEGSVIAMLQGVDADAHVDFSFPQDMAPALEVGAEVTLSGPHIPGGSVTARIVAREAAVDPASRALALRAKATGLGDMLIPGSFIDVTASAAGAQMALTVPLTAVRRAPYGDHVFILQEENGKLRARQRFVKVGAIVDGTAVIAQGLNGDEKVAATGAFKLRDGVAAVIVQIPAPAAALARQP